MVERWVLCNVSMHVRMCSNSEEKKDNTRLQGIVVILTFLCSSSYPIRVLSTDTVLVALTACGGHVAFCQGWYPVEEVCVTQNMNYIY